MKTTRDEIEMILALLEQTPQRIAKALVSSQGDVYFTPDQKTWSVHEVLVHLRACADVWGQNIEKMLLRNKPILAEIHPHAQARNANYKEQDFVNSLRIFVEQRENLLQKLKNLHFEDWSRSAMIGGRRHTVFSQARRMAMHEPAYCEQIENLLK